MTSGGRRVRRSLRLAVPRHDPEVLKLYPAAKPNLASRIARLDVEPKV
jgi:hypothetical protein